MAVYYWVGGSGDWQDPTKWSTSSGGPGGAVVPLDTDDMIFDTNSSGGSYIVEAFGMACKNLTASAPAAGAGTLTFNDARIFVRGGNFSIYSGCLWTSSVISFCGVDQSSDNTGVPRTYSADFSGSGTRTSIINYSFSSSTSGDILNFCNSRTQTFANVNINTAGRVNSTSSNISIVGEPNTTFAYSSLYSANIVNLSGTINVGPTVADGRDYLLSIYATTTLTATSLTVNARGSSGSIQTVNIDFYSYGAFATSVGAISYAAFAYGTAKVDTVGSVTFNSANGTLQGSDGSSYVGQVTGTTTVTANANLNYALPRNFIGAVSVADGASMTSTLGFGSSVFSSTLTIGAGSLFNMGSGDLIFNGAVTTNGTQALPALFTKYLANGNPVTFNASPTFNYTTVDLTYSDVTVNAPIAINSSAFSVANLALNAALTFSNLATGDTTGIAMGGTLTSNASGTISMTAATGTFLSLNVGYANLAASFAVSQGASGNASLNFGSGLVTTSTFTVSCTGSGYAFLGLGNPTSSFNSLSLTNTIVSASGISVNGGVGRSFVYNVTAACPVGVTFDCTSLTVTTPTCSITGVVSRRVDMTGGTVSITGSTPTLSHVSFYQTTINNGLSAFTGTRLGTDGLSSGFVAQTPAQKFLVLGGATAQINTAVWALTSGGATSVNNYPLPQDTVVINAASGGGTVDFTNATAYLGSISVIGGAFVQMLSFVNMYGNYVYQSASAGVYFQQLNVYPSGISARSLTLDGGGTLVGTLSVYILPIQSFNFIGTNATLTDWTQIYFSSGNITLSPTVTLTGFLGNSEFVAYANNANDLNIDGSTTISTVGFYLGSGYPFVNVSTTNYTVRLYDFGFYVNGAPATARNGSVVAIGNSATIQNGSTTATNPIVELRFQNVVPTTATTINLGDNTFVQNLTSGNSTASNTARLVGAAGRTITKTNGGSVGVSALQVTNVRASPANTFYAVAPNSSLVGDTAGWTLGTPPTTSSGGFLLF